MGTTDDRLPNQVGRLIAEIDASNVVCISLDGRPLMYMSLDAYLKFKDGEDWATEQADG